MTRIVEMSPLEIVGYEADKNLRSVSWNQLSLEAIARSWKLTHGQAVLFCNTAKDRFRLVAVFYGLPVLILPPVNPEDRISLYLKISQFLRKFRIEDNDIGNCVDSEIELATGRIERRRRSAEKARKRRLVA